MIPESREDLISYCKAQLGEPVIKINVAAVQVDNAVDEALQTWQEYHYDAVEKVLFQYQITQEDIDRQYITLPSGIASVVRIVTSDYVHTGGYYLFNLNYYFHMNLNDLMRNSQGDALTNYQIGKSYLELVQKMTNPDPIFNFVKHRNKLTIDCDWKRRFKEGQWIVLEVYALINPKESTLVWNDKWLKQYTTALIKKQWGNNLKKFNGVQLPGSITLDGKQIYDEAIEEIEKLLTDLEEKYSPPARFFVG